MTSFSDTIVYEMVALSFCHEVEKNAKTCNKNKTTCNLDKATLHSDKSFLHTASTLAVIIGVTRSEKVNKNASDCYRSLRTTNSKKKKQ
jgi:hypothetical protein